MSFINKEKVIDIISKIKGEFFSITFEKRKNREVVTRTGRLGVKKGVTGKGLGYNPRDKNLIVMWDSNSKKHKCIPIDSVLLIKHKNRTYNG